jgi:hypothetical protein
MNLVVFRAASRLHLYTTSTTQSRFGKFLSAPSPILDRGPSLVSLTRDGSGTGVFFFIDQANFLAMAAVRNNIKKALVLAPSRSGMRPVGRDALPIFILLS